MDMTPAPAEGRIVTEMRGPILLIGIDRPAKRNGFTPPMMRALAEAYTRLDDDPALRVGVLHAMGDHFTAGLDLPAFAPLMQRGEYAVPHGLVDPLNLGDAGWRRRTKPLVVAVKGITFTLGIELMLAADIVVAADDCRFSQLEVARGRGGGARRRTGSARCAGRRWGVGSGHPDPARWRRPGVADADPDRSLAMG
jgi:enoyl-CoA hydratase